MGDGRTWAGREEGKGGRTLPRSEEESEKLVAYPANENAEQSSAQYVARIVNAKINTGIAHQGCPQEKRDGEQAASQHHGNIGGKSEEIGGVAGHKTVLTAKIAADSVHHVCHRGVVSGAQAVAERLQERAAELVCQKDGEGKHSEENEELA